MAGTTWTHARTASASKACERQLAIMGSPTGLGLGLYIVYEVAAAHGSRVRAKSPDGDGMTFTLHLPNSRP